MASFRGQSIRRFEDARFLTGRGRFIEDVALPGQLWGHVLRSPHAHADIVSIDVAAARTAPGVHAVLTVAELDADGIRDMPCIVQIASDAPLIVPPRPALARGRVRHVGDPVAFVVADTRETARDAAELIEVDYAPLPVVTEPRAALTPDAPELWPQAPGNVAFRFRKGDRTATDAAFAAAAHIVSLHLINNRLVVAPLETRGAIGRWDSATDGYELLFSGQDVHAIRDQLVTVLGRPPERIRLVAPDVGGGFGVKNFLYPELVLVLWAAKRLGRPVAWIGERGEDFLSSAQARDNDTNARLALDAEGHVLGLDVETVASQGAYLSSSGPGSSTNAPSTAMGGVYRIPAIHMDVRGVFTNTLPIDAYRGAGKPEANYIIERLLDRAARQLGIDAAELRRRNMVDRFPYRMALGSLMDGGRWRENLEDAIRIADRAGFAARRAAAAARGRLRGLGLACFLETSRGKPNESACVRFAADGKIELVLGTQSNGQGHETSFPQVAGDLLGLPMEAFRYVQADTFQVPSGAGHGGARSLHQGGAALVNAIDTMLAKARIVAARLLQADPAALHYADGRFIVPDGDIRTARGIDLWAVAEAARDPANLPDGMAPGLDTEVYNKLDVIVFPSGCHLAEVEIDPETGALTLERYVAVDDYGRLINPMLTLGQVQGGVTQGIGQAMLERTVYDPTSGQLLTGSLMDYCLPRAADLPAFEITLAELPTASTPLGVKGSGQAGAIAAPQTIVHAVLDALSPLGVTDIDMPITAEGLWRAIRAKAGATAAGDPA